jgi:hypothetical protein
MCYKGRCSTRLSLGRRIYKRRNPHLLFSLNLIYYIVTLPGSRWQCVELLPSHNSVIRSVIDWCLKLSTTHTSNRFRYFKGSQRSAWFCHEGRCVLVGARAMGTRRGGRHPGKPVDSGAISPSLHKGTSIGRECTLPQKIAYHSMKR